MVIKTGAELAAACKAVALNHKTLYVRGCFGWPLTESNKARAIKAYTYNSGYARKAMIQAADSKTFAFDCVCMIKAVLWGWAGDPSKSYGGARYKANGVPDINADQMIKVCNDVSADFKKIQVGEVVWMPGHIGVYIGAGLAVECTPKWENGVQITAVHNIGTKSGYNGRTWKKHGKLPYVEYSVETVETPEYSGNLGLPTLRDGSKGATVKALQILLIGNGYSCGSYGADGDFGTATENGVMQFQDNNGLTVDGICGPRTWAKLLGV